MKHVFFIALATLLLAGPSAIARDSDKGYLTVDSDPATVQVYVDGQLVKPATVNRRVKKFELPAGRHTVRLVQDGYVESTQHIYVTPKHVTGLAIALRPSQVGGAEDRSVTAAGNE